MQTPDYGWAMDGIAESTRLLWSNLTIKDVKTPKYTYDDMKYQINQTKQVWRNSCTLACAVGAVADNIWFIRPEEDLPKLYTRAVSLWLNPAIGWFLYKAIDLVRVCLKERYDIEVSTLSVKMWSDDYYRLLDMWYSVATWYRWNAQYNEDKNKDRILDHWWIEFESTYGHAIRNKKRIEVVDNYFGILANIYKHKAMDKMIWAGRQFARGFIFFQKHTMPINPNTPEHNAGVGDQQEIVKAREQEVTRHNYKNYTDSEFLNKMQFDLGITRLIKWLLSDMFDWEAPSKEQEDKVYNSLVTTMKQNMSKLSD